MTTAQFTRTTTITPAFDKRHKDPSKDYGIGCCDLRMVLVGPLGAVQFVAFTGWYLPQNFGDLLNREMDFFERHGFSLSLSPRGIDVGYHSPHAMYEGQEERDCEVLPGGKCFYDGSSLRGDDWCKILVAEGSDAIWQSLEEEYRERFEAAVTEVAR